jgi:pectin methylesterase-like acyl-CoA thioesterase
VKRSLVVGKNGHADFASVQQAVDALPISGGDVAIMPGTYREMVCIRKPHVHLHGTEPDTSKTVIVFSNGAFTSGGTFNTASVFVEADDVSMDHLTIANDFGFGKGQAVALAITGDRGVFRDIRLLGAQDTLFAASKYCYGDYGPCVLARQYFADCYVAGNVDFIFGDSKAIFDHCELHGIAQGSVMYTAQDKHSAEQPSGYVFNHCRLTAEPGADARLIALGRPWRPYSTVVYLNTEIDAPVEASGWTEWPRFGIPSLPTAFYAEFNSQGPGASPSAREPYSHQISAKDVRKWSMGRFFEGWDAKKER